MADLPQSRMNLFDEPEQLSLDFARPEAAGAVPPAPVECLGRAFESDAARRAFFLARLREKLADPAFRQVEGFPLGSDEAILALSDPPYYTACPNPFIEDFIRLYGQPYDPQVPYHREPFAADVSEGKNDPIYNAHSYHTKVPHKAIMRYILHYTAPGDLVFDGFCGTGMTGVAARMCGDKAAVESLGYRVLPDGTILDQAGQPFSRLGARRAILNDLSPAATFIAYNYNTPVDLAAFEREARRILAEVEKECGWMYETLHTDGQTKGRINYVVWSDVFVCPQCAGEVIFWDAAVDEQNGKVRDEFPCPHCNSRLTKRTMERAWVNKYDSALGETIRQARHIPVQINYTVSGKRYKKKPDAEDFSLLDKLESGGPSYWYPSNRMPEGAEARRNDPYGITHAHHFYTPRNLSVISALFGKANAPVIRWLVTGILQRGSRQHQIAITRIGGEKAGVGGATAGHRRGTLYIPSNQVEFHPLELFEERLKVVSKAVRGAFNQGTRPLISTGSATASLPDSPFLDYIFIDPPFGGNIMYSELNSAWEGWLQVFTNNKPEAIENHSQGKSLNEYQALMMQAFQQFYNALKPGRWLTIEFHNSKNNVWNAIQEALQVAGFVVADVRTLNKKLETHTQRTAAGSVNHDLVISCYKPNRRLEERFRLEAGTPEGAWDFVQTHLRQLPVFVAREGKAEPVAERMNYMLFDRMVAFHVQRGVLVPLSAAEFYAGVQRRFEERDGMYFLPGQALEYDRRRLTVKEILQLQLIITGEDSAIQWLRRQLTRKPQTFQELHPQFTRELGGWLKYEKPLELAGLLEENFLRCDGRPLLPAQLVAWLKQSSAYREQLRELEEAIPNYNPAHGLETSDPALLAAARDRWYVPDPNRAGDLEKLREKALLREFETYRAVDTRRLKQFRLEAVRAGFKRAWQEREYPTIIAVARKLPEDVLQEDARLLMWYDQALMRTGV